MSFKHKLWVALQIYTFFLPPSDSDLCGLNLMPKYWITGTKTETDKNDKHCKGLQILSRHFLLFINSLQDEEPKFKHMLTWLSCFWIQFYLLYLWLHCPSAWHYSVTFASKRKLRVFHSMETTFLCNTFHLFEYLSVLIFIMIESWKILLLGC